MAVRYLNERAMTPGGYTVENLMISGITLDMDRSFERGFQLSIFSRKFRILMYVMTNPGCSIKDAQAESGLSYRGFHMKLKEMLDAELISLEDDPTDGRRKRMMVGRAGRLAQQRFQAAELGCDPASITAPDFGDVHTGK